MHIPDGYLGPYTYIALFLIMIPIWLYAGYRLRQDLRSKQVPLLALSAAFSFIVMMFNLPVPGGSSGHAVGGAIIGIILGPWAAVVSISVALIIQALLFGDGGITAIGANCFNMAFVLPLSAYLIYNLLKKVMDVKMIDEFMKTIYWTITFKILLALGCLSVASLITIAIGLVLFSFLGWIGLAIVGVLGFIELIALAYIIYKIIITKFTAITSKATISGFLSGYVSLVLTSALVGFEFGIQPILHPAVDGVYKYMPYGLSVTMPAMVIEHLLFFGIVEGLVTALVLNYILETNPDIMKRKNARKRSNKNAGSSTV